MKKDAKKEWKVVVISMEGNIAKALENLESLGFTIFSVNYAIYEDTSEVMITAYRTA